MPENYKHMIQCTGTTNISNAFFAKPAEITIIKDIIICNQDVESRKFSIAIVKNAEVLEAKHYIFYDTKIDPKETISITGMWCIDPGSTIGFYADKNDVVSLNAFGLIVSN